MEKFHVCMKSRYCSPVSPILRVVEPLDLKAHNSEKPIHTIKQSRNCPLKRDSGLVVEMKSEHIRKGNEGRNLFGRKFCVLKEEIADVYLLIVFGLHLQ